MRRRFQIVYKPILAVDTKDTLKFETKTLSGTLKKLFIDIPVGVAYSAGVRLEITGTKTEILPKKETDSEEYFTGDDTDLPFSPNLEIKEGTVKIFGANSDAVNPHKFVIILEIEEAKDTKGFFD